MTEGIITKAMIERAARIAELRNIWRLLVQYESFDLGHVIKARIAELSATPSIKGE